MCKFESSHKDESRWQSTDSSKAYRNTSAFKCTSNKCEVRAVTNRSVVHTAQIKAIDEIYLRYLKGTKSN